MTAFRSFLFLIWLFGGSAVIAIGAIPLLVLPRGFTVGLMHFWGRFVCFGLRWICGVKIEVRGTAPTGAALIAAKHQSMLDICGPFTLLPDTCFVMKKELLRIPLFGLYAMKCRMIWLDRSGHSAALRKLVTDTQDRMQDDRQVVIFPEGTRTPPGQAGHYQPGIAALYRDLGLPCIPCATNSGVHWQGKGGFMRWPGTVVFEYLEPIPAGLKRGEFMKQLEERIEAASNALLAEGL
jgi:1-acyl-sn-glycerol-3-phosphate acyltransferase